MKHYAAETFRNALGEHSANWNWETSGLTADFSFADFATAFEFMTKVAKVAERIHHHPDWKNSYNRVSVSLFTHDQNAVTDLDIRLAKEISVLAAALI